MAEPKSVIFKDFNRGVAKHPAIGIGLLRNVDIDTNPGTVRLRKTSTKITSTTIATTPYWIKKDPNSTSRYFALDAGGQLYITTNSGNSWSTVAGETSGGAGQGMEIWKGYVVVARATAIDLYSIAGATWTNSFKTDLDATQDFHTMLASVDDCLYICAGRYVAKLQELTTFDPSSGSTYSWTARAITLPQYYNSKCLVDYGANLMVGTWKGVTSALYEKVADIFPYNRSTLTLGIPVKLGENGVHAMIVIGNRIYAITGINAKVYVTDGSSAAPVTEIPDYAINLADTGFRLDINPGAICYHKGKILFGTDNSGAVTGNCGVWGFTVNGGQMRLENTISTGNDGSSAEINIGSLFSFNNESYWIGWKDFGSSAQGIDQTGASTFYQSYGGIIETELQPTGTALRPRTFNSVSIFLNTPLASGEGVRIKYRTDTTSSFTTLATFDYATYVAKQYITLPASIQDAVFVQLRIELTSSGSTTPDLALVTLD